MKLKLLNFIVGKNVSRIVRIILTALGTFIVTLPLFDPSGVAIDPSIGDAADAVGSVSAETIKSGEFTLADLGSVVGGLLIIALSKVISYGRAKNPTVTKWLAPIVGRSIPSLIRTLLTATGVILARYTGSDLAPDAIAHQPLVEVLALALPILIGNVFSTLEDGKKNPKPVIS